MPARCAGEDGLSPSWPPCWRDSIRARNDTDVTVPKSCTGLAEARGILGCGVPALPQCGAIAAGTVRSQIASRAQAQIRHRARRPDLVRASASTWCVRRRQAIRASASPRFKAGTPTGRRANNPVVVETWALAVQAVRGARPPFVVLSARKVTRGAGAILACPRSAMARNRRYPLVSTTTPMNTTWSIAPGSCRRRRSH